MKRRTLHWREKKLDRLYKFTVTRYKTGRGDGCEMAHCTYSASGGNGVKRQPSVGCLAPMDP